jgi:hypothetical protein
VFGEAFAIRSAGEILGWSRLLDDQEALCIVNTHGTESRGADVLVDASLNPPGTALTIAASSVEAAGLPSAQPVGSTLAVGHNRDGAAFVQVRGLPPSEVLVLVNRL